MEPNFNEMSSQDYFNASIIFSQALSMILEDGQGIIVDIKPEAGVVLKEETAKVVVFKSADAIHIQKMDGDYPEGSVVTINFSDEDIQE
jgi:hypothetical protein